MTPQHDTFSGIPFPAKENDRALDLHSKLLSHRFQHEASPAADHARLGSLHAFLGGIVRDLGCTAIAVNGTTDHVHLLIRYRADLAHSDMLRQIKSRSSSWIHQTWPELARFAWQEGYGGFTVSKSVVPVVEAYIARQKEHHERQDFKTEFLELLRRHEIDFDEEDVFE